MNWGDDADYQDGLLSNKIVWNCEVEKTTENSQPFRKCLLCLWWSRSARTSWWQCGTGSSRKNSVRRARRVLIKWVTAKFDKRGENSSFRALMRSRDSSDRNLGSERVVVCFGKVKTFKQILCYSWKRTCLALPRIGGAWSPVFLLRPKERPWSLSGQLTAVRGE